MPQTTETAPAAYMLSAEIVECIKRTISVQGLAKAMSYFEGMEHILSGASFWADVKREADELFVAERKRQEQHELELANAGAPKLYQMLPAAQSGVNNYGTIVDNHDAGIVSLDDKQTI